MTPRESMTGLEREYSDAVYDVLDRLRRGAGLLKKQVKLPIGGPEYRHGISIRNIQAIANRLGTTASAVMREAEQMIGWED